MLTNREIPRGVKALNEVPGYESRQCPLELDFVNRNRPSMKCRDMNPGNTPVSKIRLKIIEPSMKCRDMNPGNHTNDAVLARAQRPSMKCRDMNPGNAFGSFWCISEKHPQ